MQNAKPAERTRVADNVGTTVLYLYQIAGGHSQASPRMATAIHAALNGVVSRNTIRPDIFGDPRFSA